MSNGHKFSECSYKVCDEKVSRQHFNKGVEFGVCLGTCIGVIICIITSLFFC